MRDDDIRKNILLIFSGHINLATHFWFLGHSLEHSKLKNFDIWNVRKVDADYLRNTEEKRPEKARGLRKGRAHFSLLHISLRARLGYPRLNRWWRHAGERQDIYPAAVGRIMRPFEGKGTPIVYDLWTKNKTDDILGPEAREGIPALRCEIVAGRK